jgi:DNA mismatch repair protein MLH3
VCVAGKRDENEQLVIIDQHAADERIRVERFFRQLCTEYLGPNSVTVSKLDPPHNVLLTSEEARVLKHDVGGVTTALSKWGVRVENTETDEVDEPDTSTYTQVGIGSIPALVEDKVCHDFLFSDH